MSLSNDALRLRGVITKIVFNLLLDPLHTRTIHQADRVAVQFQHMTAEFKAADCRAASNRSRQVACIGRGSRCARRHLIANGYVFQIKTDAGLIAISVQRGNREYPAEPHTAAKIPFREGTAAYINTANPLSLFKRIVLDDSQINRTLSLNSVSCSRET